MNSNGMPGIGDVDPTSFQCDRCGNTTRSVSPDNGETLCGGCAEGNNDYENPDFDHEEAPIP